MVLAGTRSVASLVALALFGPGAARAHGRPATLGGLVAQPDAPERLVAQATWGLALSDDGGLSFRWLCAAALGVDARTEDPAIVVADDGAILAGTYEGLLRSDDGGCDWARPDPALADVFVIDLARAGPGRLLAVATDRGDEDRLYASDDAGRSWTPLAGFGAILIDRVRVAPSDPMRVYASGGMPTDGVSSRRAFLLRSDDGGAHFTPFELPLEDGERLLHVWGVDPGDPDVLFGQVLHFRGDDAPERIVRSDDGGETFDSVLAIPYVGGLIVSHAGAVYAGSRLGGLHRSEDGVAFTAIDPDLAVTCLSEIEGTIWACVDARRSGHALSRSEDGVSFEPVLRLAEISEMVSCPRCSGAGIACPAWTADVVYDLQLDAALPPEFDPDAGIGAPRDAGVPRECLPDAGGGGGGRSDCGCRATAEAPSLAWTALVPLALFARRRRRRRTPRRPTRAGPRRR